MLDRLQFGTLVLDRLQFGRLVAVRSLVGAPSQTLAGFDLDRPKILYCINHCHSICYSSKFIICSLNGTNEQNNQ